MNTVLLQRPIQKEDLGTYEQLGIQFQKADSPEKVEAILPIGWTAVKRNMSPVLEVTFKNRKGSTCVILHETADGTNMCCRYQMALQPSKKEKGKYEVVLVDCREKTVIYTAGITTKKPEYDDKNGVYISDPTNLECPVRNCIEYANKHYKNWRVPQAYWSDK